MMLSRTAIRGLAMACVVFTAACSSHGANVSSLPQTAQQVHLATPMSLSPGRIKPPPMIQTPIQPASAMSGRTAKGAIQGLGYSQLPGQASGAAAAPDGSLWVLSDQPAGPNKYIWHYSGGVWTNISGLASKITVAPNGNLYVINSLGNAYYYNGTSWTGVGGGCVDITVASDGSFYVISNGGPGPDFGIWHYTTSWSQSPGGGVKLAASWDTNTYTVNGQAINPGGFYVINSIGSIFYTSGNGTFVQFPGAASAIAPSGTGGLFALGYPTNANGNNLFYFDLSNSSWSAQPGAGVSISAAGGNLFIVSASAYIYKTAVTAAGGAAPVSFLSSGAGSIAASSTSATVAVISEYQTAQGSSPSSGSTTDQGTFTLQVGSNLTPLSAVRQAQASTAQAPSGDEAMGAGGTFRDLSLSDDWNSKYSRFLERFRGPVAAAPVRTKRALPAIGTVQNFYISSSAIGSSGGGYAYVPFQLAAISNHGLIWMDSSLSSTVLGYANQIGTIFDNSYASDTSNYGSADYTASSPGMSYGGQPCNDDGSASTGTQTQFITPPSPGYINVMVANGAAGGPLGGGVGGYFSSLNYMNQGIANCFSPSGKSANPSNQIPMIVVGWFSNGSTSSDQYELNEDLVRGTAHELQHLINFVNHIMISGQSSNDPRWLNEGMSVLSQDLASAGRKDIDDAFSHAAAYLTHPQYNSITGFLYYNGSTLSYNCGSCYGASYLFARYMFDRFGGSVFTQNMTTGSTNGHASLLRISGYGDLGSLLGDFATALAVSNTGISSDPKYNFTGINLRTTYPSPNGLSSKVFNGPATASVAAGSSASMSPMPAGAFAYYNVTGLSGVGNAIKLTDTSGGTSKMALTGSVIQR